MGLWRGCGVGLWRGAEVRGAWGAAAVPGCAARVWGYGAGLGARRGAGCARRRAGREWKMAGRETPTRPDCEAHHADVARGMAAHHPDVAGGVAGNTHAGRCRRDGRAI